MSIFDDSRYRRRIASSNSFLVCELIANKDTYKQRRSSIRVVELEFEDGWLTCDRDKPTYISLARDAEAPRNI